MDHKRCRWYFTCRHEILYEIPKTHEYLLVTDIGNTVTEYGQRYNTEICNEMFGIFTEEVDRVTGMILSAIKSLTKESEWTY